MKMKINNKGFTLVYAVIFITISSALIGISYEHYNSGIAQQKETYLRIQATNYAAEGIEKTIGYFRTMVNQDRTHGWPNYVSPIIGNIVVNTTSGNYALDYDTEEKIYDKKPYHTEYIRIITVKNGVTNNEKIITSKVFYSDDRYIELSGTEYNNNSNN